MEITDANFQTSQGSPFWSVELLISGMGMPKVGCLATTELLRWGLGSCR